MVSIDHFRQELLAQISVARDQEREQSQELNDLAKRWQEALGAQVSTEALQQAALGKVSGKVTEWLKSKSLDRRPRVAQQLRVDRGWERAVETVLGSYLEAVCVEGLDSVTGLLASFDGAHLAIVSMGETAAAARIPTSLQAKVQGAAVLGSVLSSVYTAETLNEALKVRGRLGSGESVVTRDGIWLGPDWLRLSRDADPRTGVIEREETLRGIRAQVSGLADEVKAPQVNDLFMVFRMGPTQSGSISGSRAPKYRMVPVFGRLQGTKLEHCAGRCYMWITGGLPRDRQAGHGCERIGSLSNIPRQIAKPEATAGVRPVR